MLTVATLLIVKKWKTDVDFFSLNATCYVSNYGKTLEY